MRRARPKNKKATIKMLKKERKREVNNIENSSGETKERLPKNQKRKKHLTIAIVVAVILFLIMGVGLFDGQDILAPIEEGKINVLLLGVDEEGLRTDTIMVASLDTETSQVNLLSIPRDTKVYVSNRRSTKKINAIHAMSSKKKSGEIMGAEATAEAVTQLTGIPINYYAEFSFTAIDSLFDVLGPVEFEVPDVEGGGRGMNYDDPAQNLHIHLKPGLQELSGNQIQQFLRYRKSNSGAGSGSDTDRVKRQQALFKAVVEQKVNVGILLKVPAMFAQISKEIHTNIETGDITKYIRHIAKLSGDAVTTYQIPGTSRMISGASYYVVNLEETKALVSQIFGYDASPTDKVSISDEHSQKILKGGNKQKQTSDQMIEETYEPVATSEPTSTPDVEESEEPTRAPEVTKTPTNTPAPTKKPTETKTPLEEVTEEPSAAPTEKPTEAPTEAPTEKPAETPASVATQVPLEELDDEPVVTIEE